MYEDYFTSKAQDFASIEAQDADARKSFELYNELTNISREIEQCRASQ